MENNDARYISISPDEYTRGYSAFNAVEAEPCMPTINSVISYLKDLIEYDGISGDTPILWRLPQPLHFTQFAQIKLEVHSYDEDEEDEEE